MKIKYLRSILFVVTLSVFGPFPNGVFSPAPFYQGKTLRIVNNDPGGTAGTRVKAVVPYLRKHIPGNATVIGNLLKAAAGAAACLRALHS